MQLLSSVHLTTSDVFKEQSQVLQSERIIEAFNKSCIELDASIFEPYMQEDDIFEDKNKYLFLAELKTLFDSFKDKKAVKIIVSHSKGTCSGCSMGKRVSVFDVRGLGRILFTDKFGFVIDIKDGILIDIFRCQLFNKDA